jgi:transcription-repair coupling factor (superfamily II helicase)
MGNKNQHFCDSSIVEFYDLHMQSGNSPLIIMCQDNEHAERVEYTLKEMRGIDAFIIPENETLPYDEEFPQPSITSLRFKNINRLITSTLKDDIFLIPVRSMIEKICDKELYIPSISISNSAEINSDSLRDKLKALGYVEKPTVRNLGEFFINPNTIEIFAFGESLPTRIYMSNKPEDAYTLSQFSPESLLNVSPINCLDIYPTREFYFNSDTIKRFKFRYRKAFNDVKSDIYEAVKSEILPRGIDYYKALFSNEVKTIAEILPPKTRIVCLFDASEEIKSINEKFSTRYSEIKDHRNVLDPNEVIISASEYLSYIENLDVNDEDDKKKLGIKPNNVSKQEKMHETFALITSAHKETKKTIISINTDTRLKQLDMMFKMKGIKLERVSDWEEFHKKEEGFYVISSDIDIGYINHKKNFGLITEYEVFSSKTLEQAILDNIEQPSSILDLNEGDPVVHAKYGVGRFAGFKNFDDSSVTKEYAIVEYSEDSNIWVSLDEMHLLSEYKGIDPENVPLDSASSKNWSKHLLSAVKDVKAMAHKLIKIKAKRQLKKRTPLKVPAFEYRKFSNEFPFTITQDQGKAINDIISDLEGDIAMDRVVVGDVGYGKTEVAMRAAMIVAFNKKQCCIIAPTTLLAEQHFETFKSRFQGFNFNIKLMTRDSKSAEKTTLEGLSSGEIDIIIGTHRLIQKDIKFKNIGLFVVDEEHRFGVKQKEDINQQRGLVDLLSLSATPIPRTLSLTMHGIRDISTIRTAPSKRLAVRTMSYDYDETIILEALKRELGRNGQAFYIHNDTNTIEAQSDLLSKLIPEARVVYAHGKMKENEMQNIMQDFRDHKYDILVATTIIETGIDIPNVNTIIMENCDKLGLAQMHQLRGRVGRSNKQAYAYLLKPQGRIMSDAAIKRIKAMTGNNNLGGGFKISNADLEIRGAGEVLGESQSGHIQEIGYQMYFSLLEKAISLIENGEDLSELDNTDDPLVFYVPSSHNIPSDYIKNKGLRASYYKALSECSTDSELDLMLTEITHRFGTIPSSLKMLAELYKGKQESVKKGVRRTKISNSIVEITLDNKEHKEQLLESALDSNIVGLDVNDSTINFPLKSLDRDGVIDYPKIASLLA